MGSAGGPSESDLVKKGFVLRLHKGALQLWKTRGGALVNEAADCGCGVLEAVCGRPRLRGGAWIARELCPGSPAVDAVVGEGLGGVSRTPRLVLASCRAIHAFSQGYPQSVRDGSGAFAGGVGSIVHSGRTSQRGRRTVLAEAGPHDINKGAGRRTASGGRPGSPNSGPIQAWIAAPAAEQNPPTRPQGARRGVPMVSTSSGGSARRPGPCSRAQTGSGRRRARSSTKRSARAGSSRSRPSIFWTA